MMRVRRGNWTVSLLCGTAVWVAGGCPQQQALVEGAALATGAESGLPAEAPELAAVPSIQADPPAADPPAAEPPVEAPAGEVPPALPAEPVLGDPPQPRPWPPIPPAASPFGTWVLEDGAMLPTFITGLGTIGVTTDVVGLVLEESGVGRVFLRDRETDAIDCVRAFALFDGETLVLDFSIEPLPFGIDPTFFFPVVVAEQDTLGIADETGTIALFSRRASLPAELTCRELPVSDRFEGLPPQQFFSDLILLDGDLVYSSLTQIERFDLDTETLGAPLGPVSGRLVQTTQGDHFWTHCGCGGSRETFRRNLTTVFDTVNSDDDLGGGIVMRAIAYVPTTDRLWIHGRTQSDSRARFTVVNTNGEPDTVEQSILFNRDMRALAFDGSDLWGIVTVATQSVVRIDMASGRVVESFEVPDEDVAWGGLVFDGADMYLLGLDEANQGVIVRSPRPALP